MAMSRGYRNYRGRRSKGKIALAVLLVLVILAAAAVMFLQQNIVYDKTGTPRLEVPWRKEPAAEEEEPVDMDLVVQEPEKPQREAVCAFSVGDEALTLEGWSSARPQAEALYGQNCNAVAVTLKDSQGRVFFDSGTAVSGARQIHEDTSAALTELLSGETAADYAIARLSCFHDPKAANSDVENLGLKNTGGYIFYDGRNSQWLDPAKPAAREYLCRLAQEAAAMGFDELLLTDISYPTEGKLDKIAYGETEKSANLTAFLEELRTALEPFGTTLSMEVPVSVLTEGYSEAAGLVLSEIAPRVDRIYAAASPEEVPALTAAVTAACETTDFVPELTAMDPSLTGSWLLY